MGYRNEDKMEIKEKLAFTLAEVLITLGVIGVVAAITIPRLITSYNKKITETRLAKFYSVFNQAIRLSVAENGDVNTWDDYWSASGNTYKDGLAQDNETGVEGAFELYLKPYMQIAYKKKINFRGMNQTLYVMPDGSAFAYRHLDTRDITFFPKDPEKCIKKRKTTGTGTGSFMFIFHPISESPNWKYHYNKGLEPYLYDWDGSKTHLKSGATYSCANSGYYCTAMIKNNGWKIPKDYPLKLQY